MADFGIGEIAGIVSIASTVAGTAMSVIGAQQSAAAQSAAASYQAQIAANNAKIAEQNATYAETTGARDAEKQMMVTRAQVGAQKAAQASNGLDVNSGSAVDVRSSTAELGELSSLNIINNAAREAYGFRVQGSSYQAQAGLDTMQAGNAKTAGTINTISSLVGGVGKTASLASDLQRTGAFQTGGSSRSGTDIQTAYEGALIGPPMLNG